MNIKYWDKEFPFLDDITPETHTLEVVSESDTDGFNILRNPTDLDHSRIVISGARYYFQTSSSNHYFTGCNESVCITFNTSRLIEDNILGRTGLVNVSQSCNGCGNTVYFCFVPKTETNQNASVIHNKAISFYSGDVYDLFIHTKAISVVDQFTAQFIALFRLRTDLLHRESDGHYYCESCAENRAECDNCESFVPTDWMRDGICESCIDDMEESDEPINGGFINNYSWKPPPLFQRTDSETDIYNPCTNDDYQKERFFAFEVEAASHESWQDIETDAEALLNASKYLYLKSDCSITPKGFEVVSHPFTFDYLRENIETLINPISVLSERGFKSYNSTCCGMHIHVSKNSIGSLQLYKMLRLIYDYPMFTLAISRRKSMNNLEEWAGARDCGTRKGKVKKATDKYQGERYNAINLQNPETVEFRIFRGTLKDTSIIMNLEIVKSLLDFTEPGITSKSMLNPTAWREFVNDNKTEYPNIIGTLFESTLFNERFDNIECVARPDGPFLPYTRNRSVYTETPLHLMQHTTSAETEPEEHIPFIDYSEYVTRINQSTVNIDPIWRSVGIDVASPTPERTYNRTPDGRFASAQQVRDQSALRGYPNLEDFMIESYDRFCECLQCRAVELHRGQ